MPDPTPKAVSCTLHMRRVRSPLASTPSECRPPSPRHGRSAITAEQRRALFAIARRVGFDTDEMRVLTPTRSISALTRLQASDLIERLTNDGHGLSPEGTATAWQLGFADAVRRDLGMGDADFRGWYINWGQVSRNPRHAEAIRRMIDFYSATYKPQKAAAYEAMLAVGVPPSQGVGTTGSQPIGGPAGQKRIHLV